MLNLLLFLYAGLGNNFFLAVLVFTILMRLVMLPLTLRQLRSTKKLQILTPKLQEIQKKYGKDRQRQAQETMKAYKEAGVSPLGCLGPMFIQFPIWIGLYQAIIQALPIEPERLVTLSQNLYSNMPLVHRAIPVEGGFLWLNLGFPDSTPILPVLVAGSMWVLQKMSAIQSVDERQQSMNNMMQWMLPLMFGVFTFTFPSGLAIYWVISNLISIVMQYYTTGWGGLATLWAKKAPAPAPAADAPAAGKPAPGGQAQGTTVATPASPQANRKEMQSHGKRGEIRQDRRGSDRAGTQGTRRPERRSRSRRHQQR
jgi:YidC/Oxa1 family membrane protein insertase